MREHTPWSCEALMGSGSQAVYDSGGYVLAANLSEVNARFIVRACNAHEDLLAACEAALAYVQDQYNGLDKEQWDTEVCLRAVIAKAKGEAREGAKASAPSRVEGESCKS